MPPFFPPRLRQVAIPALLVIGVGAGAVLSDRDADRAATMPEGTLLIATLTQSISTATAAVADPVVARTVHPVLLPDGAMIPAGAAMRGTVTHVTSGRHDAAAPELGLRFTHLDIDGDTYAITTAAFHVHGQRHILAAGLAPAGRAVMGGSLRRPPAAGRDVPRPGVAGTAIGTGTVVGTDGHELVLSAGRRLQIRLIAPVEVRYDPATAGGSATRF